MVYARPTSIRDGARLLDKAKPGWEKIIDTCLLNMSRADECILGQLYGSYNKGVEELFNTRMGELAWESSRRDFVFGDDVEEKDWIIEIEKRLNKVKGMNFQAALTALKKGKRISRHDNQLSYKYLHFIGGNISTDNGMPMQLEDIDVLADDWYIYQEPVTRLSDLKPGQSFKSKKFGENLTLLKNKNLKLGKPYYLFSDVNHNVHGVSENLVVEPFKGM